MQQATTRQATTAQRRVVLSTLLQIVQGTAQFIADITEVDDEDADEYEGCVGDHVNTMRVVWSTRERFVEHNCLMQLAMDVRDGLDTAVYEETFDTLDDADVGVDWYELYEAAHAAKLTARV